MRMKKLSFPIWAFLLIASYSFGLTELLPQHKEWLVDVEPIITKMEREIFLKLQKDEDRDKFIRFFWRARDPYPDTAENEFYKEYMERVAFANQNFGRGTGKKGSQTERGYHYLLLGPPLERTYFTTQSDIWPLELWFYKGEIELGLPAFFYLIFYQPQGSGEYRLYLPGVEGPEKLVIPAHVGPSLNRGKAYQAIKKISGELANASLSYLPGAQMMDRSGFSSNTIIASIRAVPEKKFTDTYARTYLNYKDYVETEYSHEFIESNSVVKVFENNGQPFLHWACEPRKINFVLRDGFYRASFELILRVEDEAGNLVLEKSEEIPLRLSPEQYRTHERQLFSFQDVLPVIPGRFRFHFLLKNKSAQDFTSWTSDFSVPDKREAFGPESLIFYLSSEKQGEEERNLKAFSFSGMQYLVNTRNEFPPQGKIGVFWQIGRLGIEAVPDAASVLLEIRSSDLDAGVALSLERPLSEVLTGDGGGIDFEPFSLASLKPGYYQARIVVADERGQKIGSVEDNFILLAQPYQVLPWVYSRVHKSFPAAEHLVTLGTEYYLTGKYEDARRMAMQALKIKDEPGTRILLANSLFALKDYRESLEAALPAYEATISRDAAKVIAASHAGLGEWSSALVFLEKLMAEATEVSVLNLAAECYLNLNQPEKALTLLQKSLELNPDQPSITKQLEEAKKRLSDGKRIV